MTVIIAFVIVHLKDKQTHTTFIFANNYFRAEIIEKVVTFCNCLSVHF